MKSLSRMLPLYINFQSLVWQTALWAASYSGQPPYPTPPCSQLAPATPDLTLDQRLLSLRVRSATLVSCSSVLVLTGNLPIICTRSLHPSADVGCTLKLVGESSRVLLFLTLQTPSSSPSPELEVLPWAQPPPIQRSNGS